MSDLHELRMELTVNEADQRHLAVYVTDDTGQWFLLDDYTSEPGGAFFTVSQELLSMVDTWLTFGGAVTPA